MKDFKNFKYPYYYNFNAPFKLNTKELSENGFDLEILVDGTYNDGNNVFNAKSGNVIYTIVILNSMVHIWATHKLIKISDTEYIFDINLN